MGHKILIGKYTLESLTNGLYLSPKDLYREYIQNAADSIDQAVRLNILKSNEGIIEVNLDLENRNLSIVDNGCGVNHSLAPSTLTNIGNSQKTNSNNRGFRGIGRLSGLGYCDKIVFSTSAVGESTCTRVTFNARLLNKLLLQNKSETVEEVIEKIVSISAETEKENSHYFRVELYNLDNIDDLLNPNEVKNYLIQNAPLPFDANFIWGDMISKKMKLCGIDIPTYQVIMTVDGNRQQLVKAYTNTIISDRVKKSEDQIKDIKTEIFYDNDENVVAIMWYAITSFNGTIINDVIKGIRIRQGNILIGDKGTMNRHFNEERFNGWLIGEMHIIDARLLPNSRRDDFEKNDLYNLLSKQLHGWALNLSKEIRRLSYKRSLSEKRYELIDNVIQEDENSLCIEDISFLGEIDEVSLMDQDESFDIAHQDYSERLSLLIHSKSSITKYTALNINKRLTVEQKKTIAKIFDIIISKYDKRRSETFIDAIIDNF